MKNNSVKVNAVLNVIKQMCAVLFPMITIPYISRILGTENYGRINFSTSVVNYFAVFAGMGIQTYGIREGARLRQNQNVFTRFASELFSLNMISVVVAYVGVILAVQMVDKFSPYRELMLIHSMMILFNWIGMDWINSAYEDYTYITVRYILAQVLAIVSMFLFVRDAEDYKIYAVITTLAGSGVNLLNLFYVRKYVHVKLVFHKSIFKHVIPLLILLGNSFAVTIYVNSDITILGILRSDTEVGVYSVATKVYTIVKQLLNAMLIVFVPRLSAMLSQDKKKEYRTLVNQVLHVLIILLIPAVVGLLMLSDEIVLLIAGPDYADAGKSLMVLSIALGFAVFGCYFSNCILLTQKMDKKFLMATLIGGVVNIALNLVAIPMLGHVGAALTTLLAELVVMTICYSNSKKCVGFQLPKQTIFSTAVGCGTIVVICFVVKKLVSGILQQSVIAIGASVVVYATVIALFNRDLLYAALNMVKKSNVK